MNEIIINYVVHKNSDDTYVAYIDGLFGSSVIASSEEEAIKAVKESAAELIRDYEALGIPAIIGTETLPQQDQGIISIECEPQVIKRLAEMAISKDTSIQSLITEALERYYNMLEAAMPKKLDQALSGIGISRDRYSLLSAEPNKVSLVKVSECWTVTAPDCGEAEPKIKSFESIYEACSYMISKLADSKEMALLIEARFRGLCDEDLCGIEIKG